MKKILSLFIAILLQMVSIHSFGSPFTITPNAFSYDIEFRMPRYSLGTELIDDCGPFTTISLLPKDKPSMFDVPGLPILPLFNTTVEIPADATDLVVSIDLEDSTLIRLTYPLAPNYIEGIDSLGNLVESACNDKYYYERVASWDSLPQWRHYLRQFYDTASMQALTDFIQWEFITYRGAKGFNLTISPMKYAAADYQISVLESANISVSFRSNSTLLEMMTNRISSLTFKDYCIARFFDNYHQNTAQRVNHGNLLIIAPERVEAMTHSNYGLNDFTDYKHRIGYNVSTHLFSSVLTPEDVTNIIDLYNPDFVLLIGTLDEIPASSTTYGIPTDIDYSTNDIYVGRWIISASNDSPDLVNIMTKTYNSENNYSNPCAGLILSGVDNRSAYQQNKYNQSVSDIQKILHSTRVNLQVVKGDSVSSFWNGHMLDTLLSVNALQFFIYRGHGKEFVNANGSMVGIGEPYNITPFDIRNIQNVGVGSFISPLGFGFACRLNDYTNIDCFGKHWLTEKKGGVSFYGATSDSYCLQNNVLANHIFTLIKDCYDTRKPAHMGKLVYDGALRYYNTCKTIWRKKMRRQYVYLGDPSFSVFGLTNNNDLAPASAPILHPNFGN